MTAFSDNAVRTLIDVQALWHLGTRTVVQLASQMNEGEAGSRLWVLGSV